MDLGDIFAWGNMDVWGHMDIKKEGTDTGVHGHRGPIDIGGI